MRTDASDSSPFVDLVSALRTSPLYRLLITLLYALVFLACSVALTIFVFACEHAFSHFLAVNVTPDPLMGGGE